jgi:protein-S-isoprenylcysteine O-methyltransferase Ste14
MRFTRRVLMEPLGKSPIPSPILIIGKLALAGSLLFFGIKSRVVNGLLFDGVLTSEIGACMGAAGLLLVIPGLVTLGRSLSVGLPEQPTAFKTRGIYRFSRNPIYLGAFVACVGSCLHTCHPVNIFLCLLTIGIHHWIVLKEEVFLEKRFGTEWQVYRRRVPRYLGLGRPGV